MERKDSEIIEDFINLLDISHEKYRVSSSSVEEYDKKTYTWMHIMEDANDKNSRNKIATAIHNERKKRRIDKDQMRRWKDIHLFASDASNKAFIKKIRHLLEEVKKQEEFRKIPPEKREFKGAVKIDNS